VGALIGGDAGHQPTGDKSLERVARSRLQLKRPHVAHRAGVAVSRTLSKPLSLLGASWDHSESPVAQN
jgi:hypothetical protein